MIDGLQCIDVRGDKRLRKCAVAIDRIGGMNTEKFFQRRRIEVVIAVDRNTLDTPPQA